MNTDGFKMDGNWQDITQEFKNSISQLNLGELLKTDNFTLLEAMSAIELMDPKMDSGMILKKTNRKIMTLEQSFRSGSVKTNHLELNELIGIIDDTYTCFANWLEGNSLAQTVMTNLYLHDPGKIEDRCLRVFSQTILKIVDSLDRLVAYTYCVEEEDFQTNSGKFWLAIWMNEHKVLNSLEDLCQYYEKLLKGEKSTTKAPTTTPPKQSDDVINERHQLPQDVSPIQYDEVQLSALIDRLRFTYNFYACFFNIGRLLPANLNLNTKTDAQLQKLEKLVQSSALTWIKHLESCLKYLEGWEKSIDFGIKPDPSGFNTEAIEGDYPTIMGFEPLINHKLLPPAYPRCPSIKTRHMAVESVRDLVIRLKECITVAGTFNQKSFNDCLESIENFSRYFRPSSDVISRSLLQRLYLPNKCFKLLKDELLQSLNEYCEPLTQASKKDETKASALEQFLTESSNLFSQVICVYGHNTARQHEKFPDIIQSFKNLQCSAFMMNGVFDSNIIYSWATFQLAKLCVKYILYGVELELFSFHEYPYVFWYLYDVLYRNEREQLELAKQFIYESNLVPDDANQKKGKVKTPRKKKNQYNTSFHDRNLIRNDAFRFLTGGLFLLTYGLKLHGKIRTPSMEFTSEEICFDHRFSALTGGSLYQSYKQTLSRLEKLEHIYQEAFECFSEAKGIFQTIGGHEECLKVCKTNMVVSKIFSSNSNSFQDRKIEFSFETHPSFPTIKV